MFRDVSNSGLEAKLTPSSSSLFDDVYNSVSSSLRSLKETVAENPYTSAAVGLAATGGLLYLSRGKIWGVAAQAEGSLLKLSSHSPEWGVSLRGLPRSAADAEALAKIRAAAQGDLKSGVSRIADFQAPRWNDPARFKFDYPAFRARTTLEPDALARIQAAAKGELSGKPVHLDKAGREVVHPFKKELFGPDIKKDTLTGSGANGARMSDKTLRGSAGTAALNADVAEALAAWVRK